MTEMFEDLLDPRGGSNDRAAPETSALPPTEHPLGRGIPVVTRPRSRLALPAMIAAAALLTGGFVYSARSAGQAASDSSAMPPAPPPAPARPGLTDDPGPAPAETSSAPPRTAPSEQAPKAQQAEAWRQARHAAEQRAIERLRSPLIVSAAGGSAGGAAPVRVGPASESGDANSAFLAAAAERPTTTSHARLLANQDALVAQGTLVAGVLETAINSDLPGMVRAVVAADVIGFDGHRVLIPRGSRVIGEYRSGLAIGQSRAFVVWTRLITPAGVSIDLGSPGTDGLGQAGLTGRVDAHFVQRFGAALLLSVVGSAGQAAANASTSGNSLTLNTASDASRVAELALQNQVNIPPTVKVRQGTPIRIFVARDLDFSGAGTANAAG